MVCLRRREFRTLGELFVGRLVMGDAQRMFGDDEEKSRNITLNNNNGVVVINDKAVIIII